MKIFQIIFYSLKRGAYCFLLIWWQPKWKFWLEWNLHKLCKSLFYANYVNICSILLVSVRNEMFLMLPSQGFSPLFTISSRQESAFSKDFLRVNFLNQLHLLHFHTSIENLLRKRCTCRQTINIDMSQLFVFHNQSSTCMGILQNVVYFFSTDVNEAMQPLVLEFCELP